MNDVALGASQARYSITGFLRTPRAFFFTVAMPLFLLVIMNTIFHHLTSFIGARTAALYYTPAMVGYQIIWAGFSSLSVTVVADREAGLLKRFRGTPMPRWVYLAAEIARTIMVVACTVTVLVAVGIIFYDVRITLDALAGLIVYSIFGTAAMATLGLAATRLCTTTEAASVVGPFTVVILSFISGVFVPVSLMPTWLVDIGRCFPLEHLTSGLRTAFTVPGSTGLTVENLVVLLLWGLGGILVALRTFRWEPLGWQ
jgi:ABC-2 type transport system permease protein